MQPLSLFTAAPEKLTCGLPQVKACLGFLYGLILLFTVAGPYRPGRLRYLYGLNLPKHFSGPYFSG